MLFLLKKKIARIFPRPAPAQQRLQAASSARSSSAREDDLVSPLHMETSYVSGFFLTIWCCAAESGISPYLHVPQVFLDYLDEGMPSPMCVEDSPHTKKRKSAWVVPIHTFRNTRKK
jgi:hypothetical protein